MYFDHENNTITCLITDREWSYAAGNQDAKKSAIESAVRFQESALSKLASVTSRSFYSVTDLQTAWAQIS